MERQTRERQRQLELNRQQQQQQQQQTSRQRVRVRTEEPRNQQGRRISVNQVDQIFLYERLWVSIEPGFHILLDSLPLRCR